MDFQIIESYSKDQRDAKRLCVLDDKLFEAI
jgi:hypothetical protein